ncbi:hypothetical protein EI427_22515 [Flammeovirga pectinis]|uniref:Uncharacterized protein n=1 Tax=Flammeovirga pectinis TaxID=2494373 RepID=A0A3S9P9W4_9BACT|nr:hypothetical protein [Flammeovirga pectinis]AZQ64998.1 hypothetical protein EI427_22515 [Flammeovirga pectinis]
MAHFAQASDDPKIEIEGDSTMIAYQDNQISTLDSLHYHYLNDVMFSTSLTDPKNIKKPQDSNDNSNEIDIIYSVSSVVSYLVLKPMLD